MLFVIQVLFYQEITKFFHVKWPVLQILFYHSIPCYLINLQIPLALEIKWNFPRSRLYAPGAWSARGELSQAALLPAKTEVSTVTAEFVSWFQSVTVLTRNKLYCSV